MTNKSIYESQKNKREKGERLGKDWGKIGKGLWGKIGKRLGGKIGKRLGGIPLIGWHSAHAMRKN